MLSGLPAGLTSADVSTALRLLYPLKPAQQLADLGARLEAACNAANSSTVTSINSGTSNTFQVEHISAAIEAMKQAAHSCCCRSLQWRKRTKANTSVSSSSSSISSTTTAGEQLCPAAQASAGVANLAVPAAVQEAAVDLYECVLHQHMQELQLHLHQTLQQVQQLLSPPVCAAAATAAAAGGAVSAVGHAEQKRQQYAPPADPAVWWQLANLLLSQEGQHNDTGVAGSSSGAALASRQASLRVRQASMSAVDSTVAALGRRLGSSASGSRYSSSGVQDMPLVAAASVSRVTRASCAGGTSRIESRCAGVTADDLHEGLMCTAGSSIGRWLSGVQKIGHGRLGVQQLLDWLQRDCLLRPPSCRQDCSAAVQWCRTALKKPSSS